LGRVGGREEGEGMKRRETRIFEEEVKERERERKDRGRGDREKEKETG
jgi:hypothetical protein